GLSKWFYVKKSGRNPTTLFCCALPSDMRDAVHFEGEPTAEQETTVSILKYDIFNVSLHPQNVERIWTACNHNKKSLKQHFFIQTANFPIYMFYL
ncbi:MAG: hypothetical protein J6R73_06280, partial [Alistipes sp.]|nr:hypothetical protein [Alistipes sp.]